MDQVGLQQLYSNMFARLSNTRACFTDDDPLIIHEPFHGIGGVRHILAQSGIKFKTGNLTVELDGHFKAFYNSLPPSQQVRCPQDLMSVPLHEVEDAHGISNVLP